MLDYKIVVPSRKRVHNMERIRSLLPTAIVCVDEREAEDYATVVPAENLLVHPAFDGSVRVRNWMMDKLDAPILVQIDDDFTGIQVMTGSWRFLIDADEILGVIENGARGCQDLELTTFCWSGTSNRTLIRPDMRPLVPVQHVFRAFGIMGAARDRKFRVDCTGRADLDWSLLTLLEDRCIYADVRFFFDCGDTFSGRGGAAGLISPEQFMAASRLLRRTWGKHVSFKPPAFTKKKGVDSASIRVSRTNKVAQK